MPLAAIEFRPARYGGSPLVVSTSPAPELAGSGAKQCLVTIAGVRDHLRSESVRKSERSCESPNGEFDHQVRFSVGN